MSVQVDADQLLLFRNDGSGPRPDGLLSHLVGLPMPAHDIPDDIAEHTVHNLRLINVANEQHAFNGSLNVERILQCFVHESVTVELPIGQIPIGHELI
jgi:hypothetical protein